MSDEFLAIVPFDKQPPLDAASLEQAVRAMEPNRSVGVRPTPTGMIIQFGNLRARVTFHNAPMPEEAAVSSMGMANLPEADRVRLLKHRYHASIICEEVSIESPMEAMIVLLKMGTALCMTRGMAVCLPACGICLTAQHMLEYIRLNEDGPRAWGVDEAEAALANYERNTLWDSLRTQAEPVGLLIGFVPAEIAGRTWFFSAGHSLFGLPELAYMGGSVDEYDSVREFFRVIFRAYYNQPRAMRAGQTLQLSDAASLALEALPERYKEFEATTGTLLVRVQETFSPDKDWD